MKCITSIVPYTATQKRKFKNSKHKLNVMYYKAVFIEYIQ